MHKSQLAGFIIDCQTDELEPAAKFWSQALGLPTEKPEDPDEHNYIYLQSGPNGLHIEVQRVDHPSRVHLDIETDDVEAEVLRLQALGARRVHQVRNWVVMEAPSGQRFCVVKPQRASFNESANVWDE